MNCLFCTDIERTTTSGCPGCYTLPTCHRCLKHLVLSEKYIKEFNMKRCSCGHYWITMISL